MSRKMKTNHQLSNLMLWSNFLSCVFYSASYPYVYAETVKAVTNLFHQLRTNRLLLGSRIVQHALE